MGDNGEGPSRNMYKGPMDKAKGDRPVNLFVIFAFYHRYHCDQKQQSTIRAQVSDI